MVKILSRDTTLQHAGFCTEDKERMEEVHLVDVLVLLPVHYEVNSSLGHIVMLLSVCLITETSVIERSSYGLRPLKLELK